jgi:hypothetical protein
MVNAAGLNTTILILLYSGLFLSRAKVNPIKTTEAPAIITPKNISISDLLSKGCELPRQINLCLEQSLFSSKVLFKNLKTFTAKALLVCF